MYFFSLRTVIIQFTAKAGLEILKAKQQFKQNCMWIWINIIKITLSNECIYFLPVLSVHLYNCLNSLCKNGQ